MSKKYDEYLNSPKWSKIKKDMLELHDNKCEICKSSKDLHVHHLTRKHLYQEKLFELMLLCKRCHDTEHRLLKKKPLSKKYSSKRLRAKKLKAKQLRYKRSIKKPKIAPKKLISEELGFLTNDFIARGGKITYCKSKCKL